MNHSHTEVKKTENTVYADLEEIRKKSMKTRVIPEQVIYSTVTAKKSQPQGPLPTCHVS